MDLDALIHLAAIFIYGLVSVDLVLVRISVYLPTQPFVRATSAGCVGVRWRCFSDAASIDGSPFCCAYE